MAKHYIDLTLYQGDFAAYIEEQRRVSSYQLEKGGLASVKADYAYFSLPAQKSGLATLAEILNQLTFGLFQTASPTPAKPETAEKAVPPAEFSSTQQQQLKFFRWLYQLGKLKS